MPIRIAVRPPPRSRATCLLAGHSVLLADDGAHEAELAGPIEDMLWSAGASVLLAENAYQAELIACRHPLSSAVIDAGLGADTIFRITSCLEFCAVPYLLVSPKPGLYTRICAPSDLLTTLLRLERPRLQ